jgi:hypothetical protein
MKTAFSLIFILALAACSTKNSDGSTASSSREWKELNSFHDIMAEAYHPYKDSANLAPSKELAKAMADEASKWAASTLPDKVNNDEMKTRLQILNEGSQGFLKLVNENAPDSVVAQSLTDLHNLFHRVQEGWYRSGKEEKEHH